MNDRFFLDTNIFVYSFDGSSRAKSKRATQLIRNALESQKGTISYQVVQEFFNIALTRFQTPMKQRKRNNTLPPSFGRSLECSLHQPSTWKPSR